MKHLNNNGVFIIVGRKYLKVWYPRLPINRKFESYLEIEDVFKRHINDLSKYDLMKYKYLNKKEKL